MGIFSGLESLGFKVDDKKIYEEPEQKKTEDKTKEVKKIQPLKEEDILFPKSHKCPVCENSFKSLAIRTGKVRSIGQDDDLRPRYEGIDPIKYDAIVCPNCGYGAISRYFDYMMPLQRKRLKQEVMTNFKGIQLNENVYSYEEALLHYKMVLLCDVVGNVSNSRKAYTCLKMAWVIRGWLENGKDTLSEEIKKEISADYKECIKNAFEGFLKAFSEETFPISGMDEMTLSFLLAKLGMDLEEYHTSLRMLANILSNKNAPERLKNKAIELKEQVREKVKSEEK